MSEKLQAQGAPEEREVRSEVGSEVRSHSKRRQDVIDGRGSPSFLHPRLQFNSSVLTVTEKYLSYASV